MTHYVQSREPLIKRLEPSWHHPRSVLLRKLGRAIRESVHAAAESTVGPALDYGCGVSPYRDIVESSGFTYVGADIAGNSAADVTIDSAGKVSFESGTAAMVLSTQVLEHVSNPQAYLAECRRVLLPGGSLVLSTHGIWPFHPDPIDYWRWTRDGLREELERAGFRVVTCVGVLGLGAAGASLVQDALLSRLRSRFARAAVATAAQLVIRGAEKVSERRTVREDAMVFVVRATLRLEA